jgi:hypothetical protein
MQSYETDAATLSMVLRTLGSVFPHVSVWSPGGSDLVLVGSASPQVVDVDRLRSVLAHPHYLEWMRRAWNMEGVEAFLAHHVIAPAAVVRLSDSIRTPINTDDLNWLEVSFGRRVGDSSYSALRDFFATVNVMARRPAVRGAIDWALVDDQRHRIDWGHYLGPTPSARARATKIGCEGSLTNAAPLWPAGVEPHDAVEIWIVGSMEAIRGSDAALGRADVLERAGFAAEALLIRSRLAEAKKDLDGAVHLLIQALEGLRSKALPLCDATTRALDRARSLAAANPPKALELVRAVSRAPFAVHQSDGYRKRTREIIGGRSVDRKVCAEAFDSRHGRTTWSLDALAARARCLNGSGSPDAALAERELEEFVANEPESFNTAATVSPAGPVNGD